MMQMFWTSGYWIVSDLSWMGPGWVLDCSAVGGNRLDKRVGRSLQSYIAEVRSSDGSIKCTGEEGRANGIASVGGSGEKRRTRMQDAAASEACNKISSWWCWLSSWLCGWSNTA